MSFYNFKFFQHKLILFTKILLLVLVQIIGHITYFQSNFKNMNFICLKEYKCIQLKEQIK